MPVNLSIKNAPDEGVQRLRQRAERHHRSLQGELLAIIEAAVQDDRLATPADIVAEIRRLGCGRRAKPLPLSGLIVTAVKVVDASALAALLFGEPEGEAVAARLSQRMVGEGRQ